MSKEPNIYKIDNKYYARKIKHSKCLKVIDDKYILLCDIKMRGCHDYEYIKGTNYLIKDTYIKDGKELKNVIYLEEDALSAVVNSINQMNKYIELVNEKGFVFNNQFLYYERISDKIYFFVYKILEEGKSIYIYNEENKFRNNFHDSISREEFINNSIYFKASEYFNDEIFKIELLVRENLATNSEIKRLSELTNRIILPKADIKYNKTFIVLSDTINDDILDYSGYRILHRPYFAMKGSTHSKWELNPYTKMGVDATSKLDEVAITFDEFVRMVREK